jgi:hypothetical protein
MSFSPPSPQQNTNVPRNQNANFGNAQTSVKTAEMTQKQAMTEGLCQICPGGLCPGCSDKNKKDIETEGASRSKGRLSSLIEVPEAPAAKAHDENVAPENTYIAAAPDYISAPAAQVQNSQNGKPEQIAQNSPQLMASPTSQNQGFSHAYVPIQPVFVQFQPQQSEVALAALLNANIEREQPKIAREAASIEIRKNAERPAQYASAWDFGLLPVQHKSVATEQNDDWKNSIGESVKYSAKSENWRAVAKNNYGTSAASNARENENAGKKQYVIGAYTYEDIIASAWLRKMYGHLVGLAEQETEVANHAAKSNAGDEKRGAEGRIGNLANWKTPASLPSEKDGRGEHDGGTRDMGKEGGKPKQKDLQKSKPAQKVEGIMAAYNEDALADGIAAGMRKNLWGSRRGQADLPFGAETKQKKIAKLEQEASKLAKELEMLEKAKEKAGKGGGGEIWQKAERTQKKLAEIEEALSKLRAEEKNDAGGKQAAKISMSLAGILSELGRAGEEREKRLSMLRKNELAFLLKILIARRNALIVFLAAGKGKRDGKGRKKRIRARKELSQLNRLIEEIESLLS